MAKTDEISSKPIGAAVDGVVAQLEAAKQGASAADVQKIDIEIGKLADIKQQCFQDCDDWGVWPRKAGPKKT